jgi:hypothetical protein
MEYTVVSKQGCDLTADEIKARMVAINDGGALEDPDAPKEELPQALFVAILPRPNTPFSWTVSVLRWRSPELHRNPQGAQEPGA